MMPAMPNSAINAPKLAPWSIIRPIKIGAAALAPTLIGKVTDRIAPRKDVPYLSAKRALSAVFGMPEQRPNNIKKSANMTGPSASHKARENPMTGSCAKLTTL